MGERAYEKIRRGLEEALRWASGDMQATVHRVKVKKAARIQQSREDGNADQ